MWKKNNNPSTKPELCHDSNMLKYAECATGVKSIPAWHESTWQYRTRAQVSSCVQECHFVSLLNISGVTHMQHQNMSPTTHTVAHTGTYSVFLCIVWVCECESWAIPRYNIDAMINSVTFFTGIRRSNLFFIFFSIIFINNHGQWKKISTVVSFGCFAFTTSDSSSKKLKQYCSSAAAGLSGQSNQCPWARWSLSQFHR